MAAAPAKYTVVDAKLQIICLSPLLKSLIRCNKPLGQPGSNKAGK